MSVQESSGLVHSAEKRSDRTRANKKTRLTRALLKRQSLIGAASLAALASLSLTDRVFADVLWTGTVSQDFTNTLNWASAPNGQTLDINMSTGNYPIITSTPGFTPVDVNVGTGTSGRLDQTAGTLSTGNGNWLFVGRGATGSGTYNLASTAAGVTGTYTGMTVSSATLIDGGTSTTSGRLLVGEGGAGTLNMFTTGGITLKDSAIGMIVGDGGVSNGIFNMDGGLLYIPDPGTGSIGILIATNGTSKGTFNQSGGTTSFSGGLWVGDNAAGAVGSYTISGGALVQNNAAPVYIGRGLGHGNFNLSGTGSVSFSSAITYVGYSVTATAGTTGTLNMSGGTLVTAGELQVSGTSSNGSWTSSGALNMSGGVANLSALTISRGNNNLFTGTGTVTISGGTMTSTNDVLVGFAGAGTAVLNISGGALNIGPAAAKWLQVGDFDTTHNSVNISSGTLNLMNNSSIEFSTGGNTGGNVFTQSGGVINFYSNAGTLLGGIGALDLQRAGGTLSSNTYNLNGGTINVPQILSTVATGWRTFNFNGGVVQPTGTTVTFMNLGAGSATTNVRNGGAAINTSGFNITVAQPLTHSVIAGDNAIDGGLTKAGAGTLTLTATNTYTGTTSITGGALSLTGTAVINNSAAININGAGAKFVRTSSVAGTVPITVTNGTLDGTGTLGAATLGNGTGAVIQNGAGTAGSLSLSALTFTGTSQANLTIAGGGSVAGSVGVTPALAVGALTSPGNGLGSIGLSIASTTPLQTNSTYDLIGFTSNSGTFTDYSALGAGTFGPRQLSLAFDNVNNFLTLTVLSAGDSPVWTGLDNGNWQVGSTGANHNWTLLSGHTRTDYVQGDTVIFGDTYNIGGVTTAVANGSININAANVSPTTVNFNNNTVSYVVGGAFGIAGTGSLAMNGTNTTTINTTNSYSGATSINAGTLILNGTLGSTSGTAIGNASNFVENAGGVITGTSSVTNTAGTTTLGGTNTYTGVTSVTGGTLNLTGRIAGTAISNSGVFNEGSTGSIIGASSFTNSSGVATFAGNNTYTGATNIAGGSFNLTGSLSGSAITNAATFTETSAGAISGGTFTNTGGAASLAGTNTFTGRFIVSGGSMTTSGNTAVGSISLGTGTTSAGAFYLSGGTLNVNGASPTVSVGNALGAHGYFNMSGGTLNTTFEINTGGNGAGGGTGTFGQFDLSGGTINIASGSFFFLSNRGGVGETSVINFLGGTVQPSGTPTNNNLNGLAANWGPATGSIQTSAITFANNAQFLSPTVSVKLNMGPNFNGGDNTANPNNVSVLNLNGGTLQTLGFLNGTSDNTNVFVNFNGGYLKAGSAANGSFLQNLGGAYVYNGGGTIDNNGQSITIGQNILAPTASGVSTIALSSGGSGYTTPPQVVITGDGTGATGYATISNGAVTGIVVTNRGTGYSTASASLVSDSAATAASPGAVSLTTNVGGGLTFAGSGTTSLTGNSTYSGGTSVKAGVLQLSGSGAINGSSTITVNGSTAKFLQNSSTSVTSPIVVTQGTLDGTTAVGAVSVGSLGTITHGNGGTGSLSTGTLSLVAGSVGSFNLAAGASTTSFGIGVSNQLSTDGNGAGSIVLNIAGPSGSFTQPLYELIQYGSFVGSAADFRIGTITGLTVRQTPTLVNDTADNAIALQLSGAPGNLFWRGTNSTTWSTGSTNNWFNNVSSATDNFFPGDAVTFDDNASTFTVNVPTTVLPSSVVFSNGSNPYNFTGAAGIGGAISISLNGGNTVIFANSNSYTGATNINSGTLQLGDGISGHDGTIASTSSVVIAGGATLAFNRFGAATAAYPITGSGSVYVSGTGTQTLSASNSFTGGTTVAGGVLATSVDNNLGATSSGVTLNGGTYQNTAGLTNTHAFTFGANGGTINVASGTAQLYFHTSNTLQGSGTFTLTGPGTLISPQGNLRIDQTNSFNGPVIVTQGGIFEYGVAGAVDGAATFTIANQGELAEQNATSIPNSVTVSGGTNSVLSFENGNTGDYTGPITLNANAIIGLRDWYNNATVRSGIIDGQITGPGGISINSGGGSGGSLTLNNSNNTYSGGTTVSASKVLANTSSALGTGSVNVSGATAQLELGSGVTLSNPLTINGGAGVAVQGVVYVPASGAQATYAGPITINSVQAAGGHFAANAGTLVLSGPITSSVPVSMRTGTVVLSNTSSSYSGMQIQAATVQLGANNAIPSNATVAFGASGNATLDLASFNQTLSGVTLAASGAVITNSASSTLSTLTTTGTSTFAGNVNDGAGTVALSVSGGQLTLTSSNTYSGPTAISGGTLAVNGSLTASNNISINSAGAVVLNAANNIPASTAVSGSDAASSLIVNQNETLGSMGFAGSTTVAPAATLTVNPVGPSTAGPISGGGTLAVTGSNSLTAQSIRTGALTVAAGSTAAIAYDAQAHTHGTPVGTSVVTTLSLNSGGTLDLTNNGIVILDTTSLGAVKSLITQAADVSAGVPHWDMPGITSSTAAADHSHAIGYALASTLPGGGSTSFNGVTFSDAVIARYTLVGDTGLKGTVDLSDYTKVVLNLGKSNALWSDGNFDYSGNVNLGDYTAVIRNLGRSDGQSTVFNATGPSAQQVKASALTLHSTPAVAQASTATDVTLLVNPTNGRVTLVNALQTGQAVITAYTINSPSQSLLPFSADGGGKYLANALENNPSVFYKASNGLTYNLWTGIKNVSTFIGEGFSNHYNANVDSTWTNYTLATSGYALGTLFKRLSSGGTKDLVFQWEDANLNTYTSVVTYVGAVPEPGSVSLVAVGAMAMLGRRRRRSAK